MFDPQHPPVPQVVCLCLKANGLNKYIWNQKGGGLIAYRQDF